MTNTEPAHQGAQQASAHRPCGCGNDTVPPDAIITERNRYFTGKFMTARDFASEQDYHRSRHLLHNRLLHGWGIVCGLKVVPHWSPDCRGSWVIVEPGIAIDCYGRELVLEHEQAVNVWTPPDRQDTFRLGSFLLSICFQEQRIEPVPLLYSEGACDPARQDYNRVREKVAFDTRPFTEAEQNQGCWRVPLQSGDQQQDEAALKQRCGGENDPEGCLKALCLCNGMIPLALIEPQLITDDQGQPVRDSRNRVQYIITDSAIDLEGRHNVHGAALTHIIGYNWGHGQELELSDLDTRMERKLKVFFDRKITNDPNDRGTGITRSTFRVERRRADEARLEALQIFNDEQDREQNDIGRPYLEDECVAVFPIPEGYFRGSQRFQDGDVIHITLKCDFIADCNGRAVDGDHLRGRTPTGDGVEGGLFESWFFIRRTPDSKPTTPPRAG